MWKNDLNLYEEAFLFLPGTKQLCNSVLNSNFQVCNPFLFSGNEIKKKTFVVSQILTNGV